MLHEQLQSHHLWLPFKVHLLEVQPNSTHAWLKQCQITHCSPRVLKTTEKSLKTRAQLEVKTKLALAHAALVICCAQSLGLLHQILQYPGSPKQAMGFGPGCASQRLGPVSWAFASAATYVRMRRVIPQTEAHDAVPAIELQPPDSHQPVLCREC